MGIDLLVDLCERVEQAPGCPWLEGLMTGFTPLTQHLRYLGCCYHPRIKTADHNVVSTCIPYLYLFVALDPLIQLKESITKLPHCSGCQLV